MSTTDYDKFYSLIDDMKTKDVENERLKKELEEMKEKYNAMRSKIQNFCSEGFFDGYYPVKKWSRKLQEEAPNFWKVLSNIDTPENMERYLFQLGCFMNNRRTKNHLVICGPSPSGKSVLTVFARYMNTLVPNEFSYSLPSEHPCSLRIESGVLKFNPCIVMDPENSKMVNKCLKFTKVKFKKTRQYRQWIDHMVYRYISWKSPMIVATNIDPSGITEDCDIIHMKNRIESEAMDHNLGQNIKNEMDIIKSVCSDIFEMRKNELIDFN